MRLLSLLLLPLLAEAAGPIALRSPDGRILLTIAASEGLEYEVSFKSAPVIERSRMGITVDGTNLAQKASPGKPQRYRVNEAYPWHGVHARAVDRCEGIRIPLKRDGVAYTLEARAHNDGVAFRFIVPGGDAEKRVPDEATMFRIPAGSTVWYHDFEGHYEAVHNRKAIEDAAAGDWAAPPLTIRLPGSAGYASITEGALFRYSGMGLQADGKRGFHARLGHGHPPSYPFRLRYKEDIERMAQPAAVTGTITTPWRVVMIGPDLNALVNCDIVHNVAPPPDPKLFPQGLNTEWVKPGRAVWKYLDGGENTFDEMKRFADMASQLGFEYNVIEGFWAKWPEQQLKELIDYSRSKGVGTILWKHSRDLRDAAKRRAFFELCGRVGAVGSKIDFFDHEHKDVVELYEACLRDGAEFKQVINFHGANKPTGESRTWPNELTREGIRGMESRKTIRAPHDATLPFTRMLAGHADYTPMVFSERRNDTTAAHQIASAVMFTSPLLVFGAHPRSILEHPAVEVIKAIPSVWDETIALPQSDIGEVAAFARRRGNRWFIAVMNGASARTLEIPLRFLPAHKRQALLVRDGASSVEKAVLTRSDTLKIELHPGGGFVGLVEGGL
jgi:alpha-glucosidase